MPKIGLLLCGLLFACAGVHRESKQVVDAAAYTAKDGTATSARGNLAPKGKMICEYEEPVGSHIPQRVCRYQGGREEAGSIDGVTAGAGSGYPPGNVPAPPQATVGGPSKIAPPASI